jgi:Zn-dependent protease with chaperone function
VEKFIQGRWFDGTSSQARPVLVSLHPAARGPSLRLHDPATRALLLELTSRQVGWPQAWSAVRTPRTLAVDLRDQGSLEIDDASLWHQALRDAGQRAPLAQRMQTHWPAFVAVMLVAVVALGAFYRWGTPWAATQVTRQVPLSWETALSERALHDLDQQLLKPSKLPPARQSELHARFEALARQLDPGLQRYNGYTPRLTLSFRSGMDANAFALPGGTIVMTDGLVEAAARQGLGDEALVGVLAHEIGHVVHRHTTRMLVEQAVLNVGLGLALGDVSSLVSMGGSLLTGLAYRRNHETEADCFAAALMRRAQLPTTPMADLLLSMEEARDAKAGKRKGTSAGEPPPESSGWESLLSSHPATPARAVQFKQGRLEGC